MKGIIYSIFFILSLLTTTILSVTIPVGSDLEIVDVLGANLPDLTEHSSISDTKIADLFDNNSTESVSELKTSLYRYELSNGSTHYSPYSIEELYSMGVFQNPYDKKRNWNYIAYGIAIYITAYVILKIIGEHTNLVVATKAAAVMREVSYEAVGLLNVLFSTLLWGNQQNSGTDPGDMRHL